MPNIINDLVSYINTCPIESRKLVFAQEIEQQERLNNQKKKEHPYPIIELRWLYFHLQKLQDTTTKYTAFSKVAQICENCMEEFAKNHKNDIESKEKIIKMIQEQKELIFNQCVSEAIQAYLIKAQNPKFPRKLGTRIF